MSILSTLNNLTGKQDTNVLAALNSLTGKTADDIEEAIGNLSSGSGSEKVTVFFALDFASSTDKFAVNYRYGDTLTRDTPVVHDSATGKWSAQIEAGSFIIALGEAPDGTIDKMYQIGNLLLIDRETEELNDTLTDPVVVKPESGEDLLVTVTQPESGDGPVS